jgi:hypothetical protein
VTILAGHPRILLLFVFTLTPKKYNKPPLNGEPLTKYPHWLQLKDALKAAALPYPSCVMAAETIKHSNTSFATVYTSHSWQGRRIVHLGKMIASSTWTRVVLNALKEGCNQREAASPRHSQGTRRCQQMGFVRVLHHSVLGEERFWMSQS